MTEQDRRVTIIDPATGAPVGESVLTPLSEIDAIVGRAASAGRVWARTDPAMRRAALRACGEAVTAIVDELAITLTLEQGKPIAQAQGEAGLSAEWFGMVADLDLGEQILSDAERILREPYGVVAAISPFNFPLILSVCKIAPALLAGNAVVLKPALETSLAVGLIARVIAPLLPDGLVQVVHGEGDLGDRLVRHPGVGKVSFTGSVATGRAIAAACGSLLRSVTLELGGNDAALVLPGTDPARSAEIFGSAMVNAGQFCAAIKRVFVPAGERDLWVDALRAHAEALVVGAGIDAQTTLGPLTMPGHPARLTALVEEARSRGGRVVTGGSSLPGAGHFFAPTIVTELDSIDTSLESEEQFGPILPVIGYRHLDGAVDRINASDFGLGASVWGDHERAADVAPRLVAGTVWTNTHADLRHDLPFGGHRTSGIGVEYGHWGLLEFSRIKVHNFH